MVVDVDRVRRGAERRGVGHRAGSRSRSRRPAASLARVRRQLAQELVEPEEAVLARKRRGAGEEHDAVLAELPEHEVRREQRAERVSVGVLVRRDEEAVVDPIASTTAFRSEPAVAAGLVEDESERSASSRSSESSGVGASSSISWVMRTPRSTD